MPTTSLNLGPIIFPMLPFSYNSTDFTSSEVQVKHKSVLISFGLDTNDDELELP